MTTTNLERSIRNTWIVVIIILAAMWVAIAFGIAYGVNEDPLGPTWREQLQHRAAEWNINTIINETLDTAERFEK